MIYAVPPFPKVIRIEPSESCNLACSHCPTGTIKMTRRIMRAEVFEKVLNEIKENLDFVKVVVLYHGGEPLLNKSFVKMVTAVKSLGIEKVKTVSNGMLLTEKISAEIINSNLDEIEISLDGQSMEENDQLRRNSDFETISRNIKCFLDLKAKLKSNKPKFHIASTQFLPADLKGKGSLPPAPEYLLKEFSEYLNEITFKTTWAMRWPHIELDEDEFQVIIDSSDDEVKNYCDHVYHTMTVRSSGDIVACCYDLTSQYVLGNVKKDSLTSIWKNERYTFLRNSIETGHNTPLCENCNVVKCNAYLIKKG